MESKNDQIGVEEIWIPCQFIAKDGTIEEYQNYEVSNLGRIRSLNYLRTRKPKVMKPGRMVRSHGAYYTVVLRKNKKRYKRTVHRLVLSSFDSKGYFNGAIVDHIDSNPSNNRLSNLHWVTYHENNSTSHYIEALSKALTNRADRSKQVKVTFLDDGHSETFSSSSEAVRTLGIPHNTISDRVLNRNGRYKKLNLLFEYI